MRRRTNMIDPIDSKSEFSEPAAPRAIAPGDYLLLRVPVISTWEGLITVEIAGEPVVTTSGNHQIVGVEPATDCPARNP